MVTGHSMLPSVTNVNTVSLVTGAFPQAHGITGNFSFDPATGREGLMEEGRLVLIPTVFEQAKTVGMRSALITAKGKLLSLLGRGADLCVSAENPPSDFHSALGSPPPIYSLEINYWVLRAVREVIKRKSYDLVYGFTTDYAMHKHSPQDERSQEHLLHIDALVAEILNEAPDLAFFVTADHGMNHKQQAIDLEKWLRQKGIAVRVISTIRDKYTDHHCNLSGSAYVYLEDPLTQDKVRELLISHPAVEEVYPRAQAAKSFRLLPERIGDSLVLAEKDYLFGTLSTDLSGSSSENEHCLQETRINLRSHGSRHESAVPIMGTHTLDYGPYTHNLDVTRALKSFFQ
jgi:phosphonoacetate hydrolase